MIKNKVFRYFMDLDMRSYGIFRIGKRSFWVLCFFSILVFPFIVFSDIEDPRGEGTPMMGLPFSSFISAQPPEVDLCPEGTRVVSAFIAAWAIDDYVTMFSLVDRTGQDDYTFDEAKLDFSFMEYKPYKISSVRQSGEDFEFLLSYGDWRDGDKDMKKVIISGRSFKIILQRNKSVFSKSLAGYF